MKYVIGIDEVGRGALAGPVVVAAVAIPLDFLHTLPPLAGLALPTTRAHGHRRKLPFRDSKKLNERQRESWFAYFKKHPRLFYALAKVHAKAIDGINISHAANVAAFRALERLMKRSGINPHSKVFLDGGLFAGNGKKRVTRAKTVVRGDEKIPAVKIASIIAKVKRDALMKRLAKKYPKYGLEMHKGYGTRKHLAAIRRHGPSKAHRATFLKNLRTA